MMRAITCVVGTRPEAIKMAPVIRALREDPRFSVTVLATGQHRSMLHEALARFRIRADLDLNVMRERQSLDHITSAVLTGVGEFLDAHPQDMVLVHGDTSTTLATALAGFYRHLPVGHVEAGLRSHNMDLPFPEEANRVLTDRISSLFFAPTEGDAENLAREGVDPGRVHITGNTVIDALFWTLAHPEPGGAVDLEGMGDFFLMTAHRRESWGPPLRRICGAVRELLLERPGLRALIPMHKNPTVREAVREALGDLPQAVLTEPLDYPDFVQAMARSLFLLSDSGGIQEEASALRKPVLILRALSERPDAITKGTGVLVGTDPGRILMEARRLLDDQGYRESFLARGERNPFGDGTAAVRIRDVIGRFWDGEGGNLRQ